MTKIGKVLDNGDFSMFAPILKVNEEDQTVEGWATDETVDSQFTKDTIGDVVDYDATVRAVKGWSQWRNIREMHQPSAAGTAEQILCDDSRRGLFIKAKIVDPVAWLKCKTGVYKGFSIGGRMRNSVNEFRKEVGGHVRRITDYIMTEISLVDNPANPAATFTMVKRSESSLPNVDINGVPLPPHILSNAWLKNSPSNAGKYNFKKSAAAFMLQFGKDGFEPINLGNRLMAEGDENTCYSGLNGRNISVVKYTKTDANDEALEKADTVAANKELYEFLLSMV